MQTQFTVLENNKLENFIGSPVPVFQQDTTEKIHWTIYNICKPTILIFYEYVNENNTKAIKHIMKTMFNLYKQTDLQFLTNAANKGLIPISASSEEAWINTWYNELFRDVSEDQKLSLLVQGGEAVNYYSVYKNESVPTHDCDSRILAGNYFNYMQDISTINKSVKTLMHKYRFFVGFGLQIVLNSLIYYLKTNYTSNTTIKQLIDKYNAFNLIQNCKITITNGNNLDYYNTINSNYNINNDIYISALMAIVINTMGQEVGVVDLFVPRNNINVLGHSTNIHSFFATEQSSTVYNISPTQIPYLDKKLNLGNHVITMEDKRSYILRIAPLGYILWDTLRMLFVSQIYESLNKTNKFMKYKQKLNCLLASLLYTNINSEILDITTRLKTRNESLRPFLAGGKMEIMQREKIENINSNFYKQPLQEKSKMQVNKPTQIVLKGNSGMQKVKEIEIQENEPTQIVSNQYPLEINEPIQDISNQYPIKPEMTPEFIKEARMHSIKFSEMTDPIDLKSIKTPVEWAGYMDNLSYNDPGWSDFRLPIDRSNFTSSHSNLTSEIVHNFINGLKQLQGGKRKYIQTKKNRKQTNKKTRKNN
jgi:hypothetical protein